MLTNGRRTLQRLDGGASLGLECELEVKKKFMVVFHVLLGISEVF